MPTPSRFEHDIWAARLELLWLCFAGAYATVEHLTDIDKETLAKADQSVRDAFLLTRHTWSTLFILTGGFLVGLMLIHLCLRTRHYSLANDSDRNLLLIAFGTACVAAFTSLSFDDLVGFAIAASWGMVLAYLTWMAHRPSRVVLLTILPMLTTSWIAGVISYLFRLVIRFTPLEIGATADSVTVAGFLAIYFGWRYRWSLLGVPQEHRRRLSMACNALVCLAFMVSLTLLLSKANTAEKTTAWTSASPTLANAISVVCTWAAVELVIWLSTIGRRTCHLSMPASMLPVAAMFGAGFAVELAVRLAVAPSPAFAASLASASIGHGVTGAAIATSLVLAPRALRFLWVNDPPWGIAPPNKTMQPTGAPSGAGG